MITPTTGWWQPLWYHPMAYAYDGEPPERRPWCLSVRCDACGTTGQICTFIALAVVDDPTFDCVAFLVGKADEGLARLATGHPCVGDAVYLRSAETGNKVRWDGADPFGYDNALDALVEMDARSP